MDRLATPAPGNVHDLLDVEIGRGASPFEFHRLIYRPYMQRLAIVDRVDTHRFDAHFPGGTVNPYRDLAAVGDKQLAHGLEVRHGVLRGLPRKARAGTYTRRSPGGNCPGRDQIFGGCPRCAGSGGLIRPTWLPSGSATMANRDPQNV